ncbi:glycosyltransferase family 4 protein [Paucibacter sp. TC2R-5]|uniref:glycosyltransferase family 4 protein n=1 Tax=Paucibacter sp. TC2R-5 TaxID=2893555 RepID=UPI0029622018|nr:glycosyltransferase family 4 protein [Paucibacter sp. TC2R-5]MCV2361802.1 glycosyltransferase family 4 protein [Paucibacter sp. TC2R-5]
MGKIVVMIGTDPSGKGGVAAVVSVYIDNGLFERFPIRYLSTHQAGGKLGKLWVSVRATVQLLGHLLSGRVALVHAHVASNGSFLRKSIYLAVARLFGIATVFHLHGGGFQQFHAGAPAWLQRWIAYTIGHSDRVVALSTTWAEFLARFAPAGAVRVIANPVYLPETVSLQHEEEGRLLFLGRAEAAKGIFDLLEAVKLIAPSCPNLRLAIGGDGDVAAVRKRAAELGIADHVEILGWVVGEAKQQQFERAEVFVLPSHHEGLPMAMLEAMAHGKAMVMTPVGGIPEAVQHEQQGLLVAPGQPQELATALLRLLQSASLRRDLGHQARARVGERFGTKRVLGQVADMYQELGVKETLVKDPGNE